MKQRETPTVTQADKASSAPGRKTLSRYLALEPRVLLDAAAVATVEHVVADLTGDAAPADLQADPLAAAILDTGVIASTMTSAGGAREILFIDAGVADFGSLVSGLGSNIEVHVLQGSNWDSQIQAVLSQRDGDVQAVHIVSHGGSGYLVLGGGRVDEAALQGFDRAWSAVRQALADDGDLLIYGCDVAAGDAGASFVHALTGLTGADVAASVDTTGVSSLGGDWSLESRSGEVETAGLYSDDNTAGFTGILADGWVQDSEIASGTSSVAISRTSDGTDWKFVGTAGSNKVDVYRRNPATGVWTNVAGSYGVPAGGFTGNGSGGFGTDMAAAGNKVAVSAPTWDGTGSKDGRVYVYTWNGATSTWSAAETITHFSPANSGANNDSSLDDTSQNDQFGFSIDLASDGAGNYRLVIGNPHEDWWDQSSGWSGGTFNVREDAGAVMVYSATADGNFSSTPTAVISSQVDSSTTGNLDRLGDAVAVGYDVDSAKWWVAAGSTGRDFVRVYRNPSGVIEGGAATSDGVAIQSFTWDSNGPNDISMDDDYMVIARSADIQTYKLAADSSAWSTVGSAFGAGGAVVMVDDLDPTTTGDTVHSAMLMYSGSLDLDGAGPQPAGPVTFVIPLQANGTWSNGFQVNSLLETAVALWRSGAETPTTPAPYPFVAYEEQQLVVPDISPDTTFQLTLAGYGTTANITYSATGTTLAANVQAALNALIGTNATTVTVTTEGVIDTLKVVFNLRIDQLQLVSSTFQITTSTLVNGKNYSVEALSANSTGARSYHYNWDPDATDNNGVTDENTAIVVTGATILANDSDPNIVQFGSIFGDALTVTGGSTVTAAGATVTVASNQVTYDPTTSSYLQTLAAGSSYQDSFTLTISDGQGGSTTQQFTVTVNGVNDVPTASTVTPLSPFAYQQTASTVAYNFSPYFTDIDAGEAALLVPSAVSLPVGWNAVTDGLTLLVTIPSGAAAGNYNIDVRVQDPQGAYSVSRTFVISVDATNNAPVLQSALLDQVALAGYDYSFTLPRTTFFDSDPAPFDNLTYTATLSSGAALPAWLEFDPVSRTFSGTPVAGDVGSLTVRVIVNDNAPAGRGGPATVYDDFILTIVNPTVRSVLPLTDGPATDANFGFTTAISENGTWLAVGAPATSSSAGTAWIYKWNGSGWTYITGLAPTAPAGNGAQFGYSMDWSTDGTKLVIGARSENGGRGAVYCYTQAADVFTLNAKLTANGALADDRFGASVAINDAGTYVLIGASHVDYNGLTDSGAAFLVAYPGGNAAITANVLPKDPGEYDLFGSSVSFDRNLIAIAAMRDDNAQGMVSRLEFNDSGTYEFPEFGAAGGNLSQSAQFFYDSTRGSVVSMTGSDGMVTYSSTVDLGTSWTISSWYKDMVWSGNLAAPDGSYNTLTRGSSDHQIIINASTNDLGAWNNTGVGLTAFVPANVYEQQLLVVSSTPTTAFTLTIPGVGTTGSITHSTTAATMASSAQTALNTLLATVGAGTATVSVVNDGALSDTLRVTFNDAKVSYDVMAANSSAVAVAREQQRLTFSGTGNFTLSVPGAGTTASITHSDTAATLATNIQTALNNLLGANATTVKVVTEGAGAADTFGITFNNIAGYGAMTASKAVTVTRDVAANSTYTMTAPQMSGWHNITAVGEGTGVNARTFYYIDGVKVGVANYKATDDVYAIGNFQGGGQRFASYVDDFRVYDRALSASEIGNIASGAGAAAAPAADMGGIYIYSVVGATASQVTKLYAPDGAVGDMLGWSIDLDVYDLGATPNQAAVLVASSIYQDEAAVDGGAVYIWRTTSLASGALNNGGYGNGTWTLESKLTSFDTTAGDYFGSDVAIDYDESTGGQRLLVGAQFEDTNGLYAGAVYAYKFDNYNNTRDTPGIWIPEKFVSQTPQGGSLSNSEFFGSAVAIADTRAIFGARWRDTSPHTNDGAVFWADLLTQGNYTTLLSADTSAADSFFLPADEFDVVALDTTNTQGQISFATDGRMVYTPGAAFKSLGVGQTATDTFTYLTERAGVTYVNTVTVTVHGVADAAQIGSDVVQVSASAPTIIDVLANDTDPDAVGVLSIRSLAGTTTGRVYNAGDALLYDPRSQFGYLRAGEAVVERFTYTVGDGSGGTNTGYVTLLVVGEDDPVVAVDDAVTLKANATAIINVLANDTDADGAGTFRVVAVDGSAALGSVYLNADGTLGYIAGSAFDYLAAGETATDIIVYTVRDDTGNESSALLTVTIVGVNDAPVAYNDGISVAGGTTALVDALANDIDPEGGELRVVRLITEGTTGNAILNTDGTISYTATAGEKSDRFSYEVIDSLGRSSIATVYVNFPGGIPGVNAVDDVAVVRGMEPVSINLTGNDGVDVVVTSVSALSGAGSVSIAPDGSVVYTPDASVAALAAGQVRIETFNYSVLYGDGRTSQATLRVYINGQYVAPALEEEESGFIPVEGTQWSTDAVLLPAAELPGLTSGGGVIDNVARMALAAMVELAAADAPEETPLEVEAEPEVVLAPPEVPAGKPGLSAVLGREVLSRRADMDAMLRHFTGNAA